MHPVRSQVTLTRLLGSLTLLMICRLESPDQIGIPLACEVADSKYFPVSNSAKEVRDKLLQACLRRGVKFRSDSMHHAKSCMQARIGRCPLHMVYCWLLDDEQLIASCMSCCNTMPQANGIPSECMVTFPCMIMSCLMAACLCLAHDAVPILASFYYHFPACEFLDIRCS